MAIRRQIPGAANMRQAIGVRLALCLHRAVFRPLSAMIAKAHRHMLKDRPPQLLQFRLLLWLAPRASFHKDNTALKGAHLIAQALRQDARNLAACRLGSGAILRVKMLGHHLAAQQQYRRLIGAEAQRGQKIALHQRVAAPRRRDQRHARLAQRLNVSIDRALACLKRLRQVFGAASPAPLQLQHNRQQTICSIHSKYARRPLTPARSASERLYIQSLLIVLYVWLRINTQAAWATLCRCAPRGCAPLTILAEQIHMYRRLLIDQTAADNPFALEAHILTQCQRRIRFIARVLSALK